MHQLQLSSRVHSPKLEDSSWDTLSNFLDSASRNLTHLLRHGPIKHIPFPDSRIWIECRWVGSSMDVDARITAVSIYNVVV